MKTVILITGPTASGKTSLALQAAKHYNTKIISADSRQCFIEMNIGVAKPTEEELASVQHYFINSHSIHEEVNAATFAKYAHHAAENIFADHDVLILAGGTGLYIKAFLEGLDDIPEISAEIRSAILSGYETKGLAWLQNEVQVQDPKFFAEGEIKNPQRLMRALEVVRGTGRSIKDFQKGKSEGAANKYSVKKFAINVSRERLYDNINARVENMIEDGLVDEVMALEPYRHLNALQTVGYTEVLEHFDGLTTLEEAVEKIKKNTRHYAKRQMTWLRKDLQLTWIENLDQLLTTK